MTDVEPPRYASRQAATCLTLLTTVAKAVQKGQAADRTLNDLLRQHREFGSRDRRFFGDAIFAWFRWYGWVRSLDTPKGLVMAWFLDGRSAHPAIQALADDLHLALPTLPTDLGARADVLAQCLGVSLPPEADLLPDWFLTDLLPTRSPEQALHAHRVHPPGWIRVDRTKREALHELLMADGAEWGGPSMPEAYGSDRPSTLRAWCDRFGEDIEVQDIASQQVVRVCNPQPGEHWWDACAGAGGKSLQLIDFANRQMELTATDRREAPLKELVKRARRHGTGKMRHYACDLLTAPLPNLAFDGVLLDAPCTGSGTWSRNPDGPWRCSQREVRQAASRQIRLLLKTAAAVKVGGHVVYAVCSVTQTETMSVVTQFLQQNRDMVLAPFLNPFTGQMTDGTTLLSREDDRSDALFVARFRRQA